MAASRDRYESPYDDGAGFGKFRKRPFRRTTQTTPYDRPPTSARNTGRGRSSTGGGGSSNDGWLSKLVDPAQRLIASGAHRLFGSFFRKRLPPPPPPQLPEPAINQRDLDEQQDAVITGPTGTQGAAANGCDTSFNVSDGHGVRELELMLKQKTFTRSEIDRLTALLQSRSVDLHVGDEEKKSEVITSKAELSQDRKEDLPIVPVIGNGIESHCVSTPIVASKVVDEDVATPAELAKAYLGSRPSKLSPSTLAFRGQSRREGSLSLTDKPFPSDSPIMSIVSRPSGRVGFPANGFVMPRARGRSAMYTMARTPYPRVQPATILQGSGTAMDAFATPSSSSQSTWENSKYPGSKQGALKRRNSVLENDIGSVGPIRRIRKKSGIFSSSGPLSIRGTGVDSDSVQQPVSMPKPALMGLLSIEKDNSSIHQSGLRPVPSKSSEMASKILHQLDALVSSREKSPTKLSPSMLSGAALRSLDSIDSSKFLETVQDNKLDFEQETGLPDVQDLISQKDKLKENGPLKHDITYDRSASLVDMVDPTRRSGVTDASTVASSTMKSVAHPHQNKRSFQMTAHEDYLELDDDDDVTASATLAEGRQKDSTVAGNKTTAPEIRVSESRPALSEGNLEASSILNQKSAGNADGSMVAEKNSGFTFQATALPSSTVQQTVVHSPSTLSSEAASPNNSDFTPPIFSFGEKVLPKEQNGSVTTLENNIKTAEKVPQFVFASSSAVVSVTSGLKFNPSEDAGPDGTSRVALAFGTEGPTDSDKAVQGNALKTSVNSKSAEIVLPSLPSSAPSLLSFGAPVKSSTLNNGPLGSTSSIFPSVPPQISRSSPIIVVDKIGNGATAVTTSPETATNSSSHLVSASAPAFTVAPVFKFGSPAVSSITSSSVSATVEKESAEAQTKEISIGNLNGAPFGGKSSAVLSSEIGLFGGASSGTMRTGSGILGDVSPVITTGTSLFGGTSSAVTTTRSSTFSFNGEATSSTAASQSQGSHPFSNGSAASAQASAAGTVSSSQSMPLQFGYTASSPSFGLTGNTALSSGSSLFNSFTAPTLLSSGAAFGATSSSSPLEASTASSSTASTVFGSSWPASQSPIFGSTFNSSTSSTSFTFGASASDAGSRSTSTVFGASSSAPSGSIFPFSSPAAATQTQPMFGNSTPGFTFGSSASTNNDQMSMEDSMAEDTVQASTPSVPSFGQQPATHLSSGLVFGSAAPSGVNQFGSSVPSAVNPFQFGGQANLAAPQNTSPFQASGSLELDAAGSFSLGSGGGEKSLRKFVKVRRTARKK